MGLTKDKLLQLEEEGVIEWSEELRSYVQVNKLTDPEPFDLTEYLFNKARESHGS
jgi:hypothetical protein